MVVAGLVAATVSGGEPQPGKGSVEELTRKLWPRERIEQAMREVERQKADGLLSETAYAERKKALADRLVGRYRPESLSTAEPPLTFIQNGGFEQINPNSAKNRSRWLWWNGWSWGGDYENMWEEQPALVHSGKRSARIRCTGAPGRIGIKTPPLPAIPGAREYRLTFWAKGTGDNLLFVNFEEGASGVLRQKMDEQWEQYTVSAKPIEGEKTYYVYFYSIGSGTIWLDDVELAPVGGKLEE